MKSEETNRFILNDESVENSYGFSIKTSGISLERFKSNPVMLDSHFNLSNSVIGRWVDVRIEKHLLTAMPLFDADDENAKKIQGKVDRGFLKGCSMGVSFEPESLQIENNKLVLTECELYEASIVAVPSNANSVRFYASDTGKLIDEGKVKQLCLSVTNKINFKLDNNMKVKLTPAAALALGFDNVTEVEDTELSGKIEALETARKTAEQQLSAVQKEKEQKAIRAIEQKVENAINAGQIKAEQKAEFVQLGIANSKLLDTTLGAIPTKRNFSAGVGGSRLPEIKTADDFQKLSIDEQLSFKANNPSGYLKLFTN